MTAFNLNANPPLPIPNVQIPPGGPRAIPTQLLFGGGVNSYTVDFTQQQQIGAIAFIQGVYVDNSLNAQVLNILCAMTNQVLKIPAGYQGYYPVLAGTPPVFIVATTGGVNVPCFWYNVPIAPIQWPTAGAGAVTVTGLLFDGGGNLKTADQNLAPLISAGGLNVNVLTGGGGAAIAASLIINAQLTTNAGVNSAVSGATKRWYVTAVDINLSADCALAAAANGNVHIWAAGGIAVFAECYFRLPAAATNVPICIFQHDFQNPIPGDALNDRVQAQMSFAALATGNVNVNVWGYPAV